MKKPPFTARNSKERAAMIKWMHGVLDEYFTEFYYYDILSKAGDECRRQGFDKLEIPGATQQARSGDVSHLRKLYPHIAAFIHPAARKRGGKHPKPHPYAYVLETADVVRRIWQAEYGRQRRRQSDGASAQEIAASYDGVPRKAVPWKTGGTHKTRRTSL